MKVQYGWVNLCISLDFLYCHVKEWGWWWRRPTTKLLPPPSTWCGVRQCFSFITNGYRPIHYWYYQPHVFHGVVLVDLSFALTWLPYFLSYSSCIALSIFYINFFIQLQDFTSNPREIISELDDLQDAMPTTHCDLSQLFDLIAQQISLPQCSNPTLTPPPHIFRTGELQFSFKFMSVSLVTI